MTRGAVLVSAFAILWFLAFFVLLPIGIGGHDPETGAPHRPMLLKKAAYATLAAAVLWTVFYGLIQARVIEL